METGTVEGKQLTVTLRQVSRRKMLENGSPPTEARLVAFEMNAIKRPFSLMAGEVLSALPISPLVEIDTTLETLTLVESVTWKVRLPTDPPPVIPLTPIWKEPGAVKSWAGIVDDRFPLLIKLVASGNPPQVTVDTLRKPDPDTLIVTAELPTDAELG
jgi:hypothetical protein